MADVNTLDRLLEIEAKARAIVNSAQEEADRRIRENEDNNRAAFNDYCKTAMENYRTELDKAKEELKLNYKNSLDKYRGEISEIKADTNKFNSLLEKYLFEKG